MTTRAQLESERRTLAGILARVDSTRHAAESSMSFSDASRRQNEELAAQMRRDASALTASIARVEALLGLSDEMAQHITENLDYIAGAPRSPDNNAVTEAFRTVANLIRREPRGDV